MTVTIILDINGNSYTCRCFENESLQVNKIVGTVDSLGSQGVYTKDFFMPLEGELLEAIGDVTDPSQDAKVDLNKAVKGRILVNGFERFKGSFFFINFILQPIKQVQVSFQASDSDLKSTLSNIKMSELFEGDTIPYTWTNIKNYFDSPNTFFDANGYCFPLIDYGQRWTKVDPAPTGETFMDVLYQTDFKPAVSVKHCFDKMPIDISVHSSIDYLLDNTILLHNSNSRLPVLDTSPLDYSGKMYSNVDQVEVHSGGGHETAKVDFQLAQVYDNNNFNLVDNEYTAEFDGLYTWRLNGTVSLTNNSGSPQNSYFYLEFQEFPSGNSLGRPASGNFFVANGLTRDIDIDVTNTLRLTKGQKIGLVVMRWDGNGSVTTVRSGFEFIIERSPSVTSVSNILVDKNCPDVTAWDIFRTIALMCNGIIELEQDGSAKITPWIEWIDEGTDNIVLDNLIEDKTSIQIKPFSLNGAKRIKLGYKPDKDYYNVKYTEQESESYGDYLIEDTGTELANNEIKIELPFSTMPPAQISGSGVVIPKLIDNNFKEMKGNPKMLWYTRNTIPCYFGFEDITQVPFSNTQPYNTVPFIGNWEYFNGGYTANDMNFGTSLTFWRSTDYPYHNLYRKFWQKYLEDTYTERSREMVVRVRLGIDKIDSLRLNENFYYKNSLWRVLSIKNIELSRDGFVTIKLMKRFNIYNNERAPLYPFNIVNSIVQWKKSIDNVIVNDASGEPSADVETSANYYGFFYDSNKNIATQQGQILTT